MISPLDLVKRIGARGRLVPFFKCVCVYFVALGGEGEGAPSIGAACAKCAPILCLLVIVALARHADDRCSYARRVCVGLALSALGDALLLWPQHLVSGMAAFGAAQIAYATAFGCRGASRSVAGALYLATALFVWAVAPPVALRAPVALYGALLATMAWCGAARGGHARTGALLFLVSDAALALRLFEAPPLPHHHVLVMSTYYLAQLAIALSALESSPSQSAPSEPVSSH